MLKYEFFNPAIQGLKPADAARVSTALDAAILYGALENATARGVGFDLFVLRKRYGELISKLNTGETFGIPVA